MADTRVVLISGPRQSGKTTLATDIAADEMPFFTLDEATVLAAANNDPVGFLRGLDRAVIDEIQRAPDHDSNRSEITCTEAGIHTCVVTRVWKTPHVGRWPWSRKLSR